MHPFHSEWWQRSGTLHRGLRYYIQILKGRMNGSLPFIAWEAGLYFATGNSLPIFIQRERVLLLKPNPPPILAPILMIHPKFRANFILRLDFVVIIYEQRWLTPVALLKYSSFLKALLANLFIHIWFPWRPDALWHAAKLVIPVEGSFLNLLQPLILVIRCGIAVLVRYLQTLVERISFGTVSSTQEDLRPADLGIRWLVHVLARVVVIWLPEKHGVGTIQAILTCLAAAITAFFAIIHRVLLIL